MDVIHFDSQESMRANLARSINARLHPLQAAMSPGDYWVDFRDIAEREVHFGHVLDDSEMRDRLINSGMTREVARATLKNLDRSKELGVFYGMRYDRRHVGGVFDVVYAGKVWPIEERLFDAAREVDLDIDRLPDWGKILLQASFIASRHYARMASCEGGE